MGRWSWAVSWWTISWISLETTGVSSELIGRWSLPFWVVVRRREAVIQSDRRKTMRTNTAPTKIPITTHNFNPNIEVFFDNSLFTNAASYTDIFFSNQNHFSASVFPITSVILLRITILWVKLTKWNTEWVRFRFPAIFWSDSWF